MRGRGLDGARFGFGRLGRVEAVLIDILSAHFLVVLRLNEYQNRGIQFINRQKERLEITCNA